MRFNKYAPAAEEVFENGGYPDFDADPQYYDIWWRTQIGRCLNGYKPSVGDSITGAYYFHLNFNRILRYSESDNDKLFLPPMYRDLDHEYYTFLDECERDHWGAFTLKARRKGFSVNTSSFIYHRWTFGEGTEIGVGAYEDKDVDAIRIKIRDMRAKLPPELVHAARDNAEILEAQEKVKEDSGWITKGTSSRIYFRCFGGQKGKTGVFKGLSLKIHDFEEVGMNPVLMKSFMESKDCWMEGDVMYGLPILGGTGDKMNNMSEDLETMWYEHEKYRLRQFFIPASKAYYPFFSDKTGKSDMVNAEIVIREHRADLESQENKTAYYSYIQNNPLIPEEAFIGNSSSTALPLEYINRQIIRLQEHPSLLNEIQVGNLKFKYGRYDGVDTPVEFEPDPHGKWTILKHPQNHIYKNLDIAGVDTYFHDDAKNSDSQGAMVVYRRYNPYDFDMPCELPICTYFGHERTTEEFYANCLKTAIYYKCKMLVEYDQAFGNYINNAKAFRYMKERPSVADSDSSNVSNKYMIHMKEYQKNLATRLIKDHLIDHSQDIFFPRLLEEYKVFRKRNTDLAMAMGIVLIHDLDNSDTMIINTKDQEKDLDFLPRYERTESGLIKQVFYSPVRQEAASASMLDLSNKI